MKGFDQQGGWSGLKCAGEDVVGGRRAGLGAKTRSSVRDMLELRSVEVESRVGEPQV